PLIEDVANAADSPSQAAPTPVRALETVAQGRESTTQVGARQQTNGHTRAPTKRVAAKPARHAKLDRVAGKSARHAKPDRVAAKPAQGAKLGQRRGAGPPPGAKEAHQKPKSKRA